MDQIVFLGERLGRVECKEYYPEIVRLLLSSINTSGGEKFNLICFTPAMRWLCRLMREANIECRLFDFADKFWGYDCAGLYVEDPSTTEFLSGPVVICSEDPAIIKKTCLLLSNGERSGLPVIYDTTQKYNPLRQDEPFLEIITKAENRARSMISDAQLLDLIQLIKLTRNLEGAVVEFGSLYGGSGAVFAESLIHYGRRELFLCDTFCGIPESEFGLDQRWNNSFSDNSYAEVRDAFRDLDFVKVIKGNAFDTSQRFVGNKLSLVYVGTDTFSSARHLFDTLWPSLQVGGLMHVCDYGSYPNCLPISAFCDEFEARTSNAISMRTSNFGIYFMKTTE
jgi:hypothetical protein